MVIKQAFNKKKKKFKNKFINARKISNNSICIPVEYHLNKHDINYIVKILKKIFR